MNFVKQSTPFKNQLVIKTRINSIEDHREVIVLLDEAWPELMLPGNGQNNIFKLPFRY